MNAHQLDLLFLPPNDGQPIEVCLARRVILDDHAADYLNHGFWQRLQHRELLRDLHGSVHFRFDGYMEDPRGLEQIPELRDFLQDWHRA